jgi:hypothetical protein
VRQTKTIDEVAKEAMTPRNEVNCSGYVRTVALDLGEYMPEMQANDMVKYLSKNPSWEQLGNNDMIASEFAAKGYLVIAGIINPHGHGHVAIIVPGRGGKYAKGYWGSINGVKNSGLNKGINQAWTHPELHEVQFSPSGCQHW